MSIQSCLPSTYLFHSVPSICLSTTALGWRSPEALSPSSNSFKWYRFQAATPHHWCKPQQEIDVTWGSGVVPNSTCVTKQLPASLWSQLCMFGRIWQAQSREYSVNLVCPHLLVYESKKNWNDHMFKLEEYALIHLCDEWLSQESKRIKWDYNLGTDFINTICMYTWSNSHE